MDLGNLQAISVGSHGERVEALRSSLGYPLKERDASGSRFWYLRPGAEEADAEDTCPIAVGFYAELDSLTDQEIKDFLTDTQQQQDIYGHFTHQIGSQQPVMYLLLPEGAQRGRVAFVLPVEGGIRQRQVQSFGWQQPELLGRFQRLEQGNLPIAARALVSIPLVEWVFYEAAQTAKELAGLLAAVTRRIEQAVPRAYEAEGAGGYLHRLLQGFQRELLPSLKLAAESEKDYSFADIYAQTIAYGLFTARVFSHVRDQRADFNRQEAWQQLPETNPFLRQLFQDVSARSPEELGEELMDCIAEVFGILRAAKMAAILSDFRQKMHREDIVIRFYEDFLAAYKPKMRERRGVYYTPEPVVSYMVRSVDILIKEKFDKPLGLADPEVMILDPACGTGTFLLWIFKLIEERFKKDGEARSLIQQKLGDISWSDYVKDHLLPRVFGFELLMAPYAICHLKLGLFLEESGYQFGSSKRLGVYLINTLDDVKLATETKQLKMDIPEMEEAIAAEANQGAVIKKQSEIMVVIGNPPYSGHSENKSEWVAGLIKDYYFVDGLPLGEKNPKWLQDDYVKFIRFSQWRIDRTGTGILAFVTNHGYLDNPTFRGMRQSLAKSFNWIRILDLHGNSKKKETAIDPETKVKSKDENVFDIQQGVAVCMMVKELNV